jgi:hypothetical protein
MVKVKPPFFVRIGGGTICQMARVRNPKEWNNKLQKKLSKRRKGGV